MAGVGFYDEQDECDEDDEDEDECDEVQTTTRSSSRHVKSSSSAVVGTKRSRASVTKVSGKVSKIKVRRASQQLELEEGCNDMEEEECTQKVMDDDGFE